MEPDDTRIRKAILDLLAQRAPGATICPSEAARALAPQGWRPLMPRVRAVAGALAAQGELVMSQRGRPVQPGEDIRGPIRLGRPGALPPPPAGGVPPGRKPGRR